jgi:hypothetical protein
MGPDPANVNTLALKMEATYASETMIYICNTKIGWHNPEDYNLNTHGCEKTIIYTFLCCFVAVKASVLRMYFNQQNESQQQMYCFTIRQ